jgi:hypothetical protein
VPESLKERVLQDPAVHRWVKREIIESQRRDPVDALHDAELLVRVLKEEYEKTAGRTAGLRPSANGYDYGLQAYTMDGIVLACGHPEDMRAGGTICCNAFRFAGMQVEKAREAMGQ